MRISRDDLVDLIEVGNELIITHGNGSQVGMINLAKEGIEGKTGTLIVQN